MQGISLSINKFGIGSILHTLFHIDNVEWSWLRPLQGKTDFQESLDGYKSLNKVQEFYAEFRLEMVNFMNNWDTSMGNRLFYDNRWKNCYGYLE